MTFGYISTACRLRDHEACQERPIVLCDCGCHDNKEIGQPAEAEASD
jgi:hypothetical protein